MKMPKVRGTIERFRSAHLVSPPSPRELHVWLILRYMYLLFIASFGTAVQLYVISGSYIVKVVIHCITSLFTYCTYMYMYLCLYTWQCGYQFGTLLE